MVTIPDKHDNPKGLHRKFQVRRLDGSDEPGGKHENCSYFVLDVEHDKYAIPALLAYANACQDDLPELAADIIAMVDRQTKMVVHAENTIEWYSCEECHPTEEVYILVTGTMDHPNDWRVKMGYYIPSNNTFAPMNGSWKPQYWAYMPDFELSKQPEA